MRIDPALLARTYRDPLALAFLIVDLLPIYAVLFLGWGAVPLVFLYWIENVIIGLFTIARMVASGVMNRDENIAGALGLSAFFTVHYGMFCFGHGVFLLVFAGISAGNLEEGSLEAPEALAAFALGSADLMVLFVFLIVAANAAAFIIDDLMRGEAATTKVKDLMTSPYGRIVVLHFAIFAGAFALVSFGEPMIGVLALILLRAAWGVFLSVRRRLRLDVDTVQS